MKMDTFRDATLQVSLFYDHLKTESTYGTHAGFVDPQNSRGSMDGTDAANRNDPDVDMDNNATEGGVALPLSAEEAKREADRLAYYRSAAKKGSVLAGLREELGDFPRKYELCKLFRRVEDMDRIW
jgi:hypothetical protein